MPFDLTRLSPAHQRALRATARIACLTSVIGCGPKQAPVEAPPVQAQPATVTPQTAAPAPIVQAAPTAATVESCVAVVNKTFETQPGDDFEAPADVKACCQTLAVATDSKVIDAIPHRFECCSALDWNGSMACTPWGPPVPPAMPLA
jgi:hypothetical protein